MNLTAKIEASCSAGLIAFYDNRPHACGRVELMNSSSTAHKTLRFFQLLVRFACRNPADLRHIFGVAAHAAEEIADADADIRSLPSVNLEQLATEKCVRVSAAIFSGIPASISQQEALTLAVLMRSLKARRVFEFGTYKGVSTTQLLLNSEPGSEILTLDLPDEEDPDYALVIGKASEREIAAERGKGALIPDDLKPAVTFLRQDSAKFDPAPYASSMDLVFVDGAHSADYVRNDSEKGWKMLRPGGVIVWHDCLPNHPDVVRYVKNCEFGARRILGTSMAMATKH